MGRCGNSFVYRENGGKEIHTKAAIKIIKGERWFRCGKCLEFWPITDFLLNPFDGYYVLKHCKSCSFVLRNCRANEEKRREFLYDNFNNRLFKCCRCGEYKVETEFGKDKNKFYGISSYCKKCKVEKLKEYKLKIGIELFRKIDRERHRKRIVRKMSSKEQIHLLFKKIAYRRIEKVY